MDLLDCFILIERYAAWIVSVGKYSISHIVCNGASSIANADLGSLNDMFAAAQSVPGSINIIP